MSLNVTDAVGGIGDEDGDGMKPIRVELDGIGSLEMDSLAVIRLLFRHGLAEAFDAYLKRSHHAPAMRDVYEVAMRKLENMATETRPPDDHVESPTH